MGCPGASFREGPGGEGFYYEVLWLEGFELVGLADLDINFFLTDPIFDYDLFMSFDEFIIILDRDFFH